MTSGLTWVCISVNADIQGGFSYNMVKYSGFYQLFALACTVSGGVVHGKFTSGNRHQAC